jgi:hypothetical protein
MLLALGGLGIIASNLFKTTALPAGQLANGQVVNANNQGITATQSASAGSGETGNKKASDTALPTELERLLISTDFSVAKRNPFVAIAPVPQIVKKVAIAPAPPPQPSIQAPPQPPMMPPLNLKFVGRVTEPNGNRLVFASLNELPVTLNIGQTLSNGFRVDAIKDNAVELTYTLLGTTTRFDLPKPPTFDIR